MLKPLIDIRNATVMRDNQPALNRLNLTIASAESVAILGPNGAGKSTLLKLLNRELYPKVEAGSVVKICGDEHLVTAEFRRQIGFVSEDLQHGYLKQTPGLEVVISGFFASNSLWQQAEIQDQQISRANQLLHELQITGLRDRQFGELSTGQQRRLLLARALVHEPHTLVLDEPTTGLDIQATFSYLNLVGQLIQQQTAVILVTHHLHEIPPEIQRVVLLKQGQVMFDGEKTDAFTNQRISELFDFPVHLSLNNGFFQASPATR